MNPLRTIVVTGALAVSSGCLFHKSPPKAVAPVSTPPAPIVIPAPSEPAPPPVLEQGAVLNPLPQTTLPPAEAPPAPKPNPFPPATNPPRNSRTRPEPAAPNPVTPAPMPAPAPSLGAILSAEDRRRLDAQYRDDLGQANRILGRLTGKALNAEQRDSVSRAQAFISQANQYHDRDLATAAELARRARVLTQDLASSLR
ncbi:MAG TPA: hypothetical protein VHC72_18970 [Bryobacteraceae bacterium]|nr:hypothetical protein [Bryobacteraceae bacterium]